MINGIRARRVPSVGRGRHQDLVLRDILLVIQLANQHQKDSDRARYWVREIMYIYSIYTYVCDCVIFLVVEKYMPTLAYTVITSACIDRTPCSYFWWH
jgi:hypothetical protein